MIIGPQAFGLLEVAGLSALLAAVATVIGAVFLGLFFWKGGLWGLLNDIASIVMMLATIPVLAFLATFTEPYLAPGVAFAVAAIGLVGMIGTSISQGLLVARVRTYQQLLPWTLGLGAIVGVWYVLVGVSGRLAGMPEVMAILAIVAGLGYVAIGYGFWRGNERHPLSIIGGIALLISSTAFLVWIGLSLIAVPQLSR